MTECIYGENGLSKRLGVPRDVVRDFRGLNLLEGKDWAMAGREVAYSAAAVRMLLKHLGVSLPEKQPRKKGGATIEGLLDSARLLVPDSPVDEKIAGTPVGPAVIWRPPDQTLKVLALTRNKQIVTALFTEEELKPKGSTFQGDRPGIARVRVRDSKNFVPGMTMLCRHLQRDLWELIGRCPRFKGRW